MTASWLIVSFALVIVYMAFQTQQLASCQLSDWNRSASHWNLNNIYSFIAERKQTFISLPLQRSDDLVAAATAMFVLPRLLSLSCWRCISAASQTASASWVEVRVLWKPTFQDLKKNDWMFQVNLVRKTINRMQRINLAGGVALKDCVFCSLANVQPVPSNSPSDILK